uniref:Root cap n=1 Tax=Kalanchoe fedtschenkoi TaxID=63787 RepID=A0A7N0U7G1_KALFE
MARQLGVTLLVALILCMAAAIEAAPKAKKVKCQDKKYPDCYHVKLLCPDECLRTCVVDCVSCQPVCKAPPPPPPSPPPPPPKAKKKKSPPPPPYTPSSPPPPPAATDPQLSSPPPPSNTPSPTPPVTTPPPPFSEAAAGTRVKCKNKNYPTCYGQELTCPTSCPGQCEVDCVTCKPVCSCNMPGAVCQDPRFIGGDGITFYFHGKKGQDFCLVSDSNLHINGHFIGRRNENMSRDFTWIQSIGILFDTHELYIGAKRTSIWDNTRDHLIISTDDTPIFLPDQEGSKWQSSSLTITRTLDVNAVEVEVDGNFKIKAVVVPITQEDSRIHKYGVTQEDCFAHLDLSFKFYAISGEVDGVLGQTYANNYVSKAKIGVSMPVLGGEDKFSSSNIFATDCSVAPNSMVGRQRKVG